MSTHGRSEGASGDEYTYFILERTRRFMDIGKQACARAHAGAWPTQKPA
jgi:hypothetical protein